MEQSPPNKPPLSPNPSPLAPSSPTPTFLQTPSSWSPPPLQHLDDLLPHIADSPNIKVFHRPDHITVDYTFNAADLFTTPYHLECRGIKFSPSGSILARPFHKFFNLGERGTTLSPESHTLHVKLDGSMIHPFIINDEVRLATRMGITDVSLQAEKLCSLRREVCRRLLDGGITPIFEYVGPDNRIVLRYDTPELVLLAARETVSGRYLPHGELDELSQRIGCRLVGTYPGTLASVKSLKDAEGVVITYPSGHRLKVKADDYVLRHRAKDDLSSEKNVIALILSDSFDDHLPLLTPPDKKALLAYEKMFFGCMVAFGVVQSEFVEENAHLSQKDFALKAQNTRHPSLLFSLRKDPKAEAEIVREFILKQTKDTKTLETFFSKNPHWPRWKDYYK